MTQSTRWNFIDRYADQPFTMYFDGHEDAGGTLLWSLRHTRDAGPWCASRST
jgi:hypothetical protein